MHPNAPKGNGGGANTPECATLPSSLLVSVLMRERGAAGTMGLRAFPPSAHPGHVAVSNADRCSARIMMCLARTCSNIMIEANPTWTWTWTCRGKTLCMIVEHRCSQGKPSSR